MRHQQQDRFNRAQYSGRAGAGFLRVVLLFGSAAVSLGLILIPLLMQQADMQSVNAFYVNSPDHMMTGSIKPDDPLKAPLHSSLPGH